MDLLETFEQQRDDNSFEYLKWKLYLYNPTSRPKVARKRYMYACIDIDEVRYYVIRATHMNNAVGMLLAKKQILQVVHYNTMAARFMIKPSAISVITLTKKLDLWKYK